MSDGTLTVDPPRPELAQADRVQRGRSGRLPNDRLRDLARRLHLGQQLEQAGVGDEEAADALLHTAQHVVDRVPGCRAI